MTHKAAVKYRSLRTNLVHLPLSLYASLAQQQARPQSLILHISPKPSSKSVSSSSIRPAKEAYLGWSGLAAASSLGAGLASVGNDGVVESLEVDPEVAMDLGWTEGTIVEISFIHRPIRARTVSVTPLTTDDWEILEEQASFLEDNLLSQLRAARVGQELNVWVQGRTKIRIRVDDTYPKSPDAAVLIHPETEIIVAPRSRTSQNVPRHVQPQSLGSLKGKEKAAEVPYLDLRLLPGHVAATWLQNGDLPGGSNSMRRRAFCGPLTWTRLWTKVRLKENEVGSIVVRPLGFDTAPDDNTSDAKVVNGDAGETEGDELEIQAELRPWEEMPEGCLVLTGRLKDKWPVWGSIRIIKEADARSPRPRVKHVQKQDLIFPSKASPPPLVGVESLMVKGLAYLQRAFVTPQSKPLLVTGLKGSGKTSFARHLGEIMGCDRSFLTEIIYEDVTKLDAEDRSRDVRKKMSEWVEDAKKRRPCLLIIDGLDSVLHPESELATSANPSSLADHLARLFAAGSIPTGTLVLVTANRLDLLHPLLNVKHIFGEQIRIPQPDQNHRRDLISHFILDTEAAGGYLSSTSPPQGIDLVSLANQTDGYVATDLRVLVGLAGQEAMIRKTKDDQDEQPHMQADFDAALAKFTPASLRGVTLQKSETLWANIGGLHEPKRILRETLEWPVKYAQIFANCSLRLRSGLLLYGYPGCGKTLLASAVARECGLNFISVKGPEILNKYIGASEKAVRDLFERASAAKPCVLFFDEFDSIAPKRGHDSTGVTDRVVNQMLTEMDGAQGLEGVYVLAATSRPDLIDPALLRPGRLDKSILCAMPSVEERKDIIEVLLSKLPASTSIDIDILAEETAGYSGADLQAMIYNAHLEVAQSSLASTKVSETRSKGKGKLGTPLINGHSFAKPKSHWRQIAPSAALDREGHASVDERISSLQAKPGGKGQASIEERQHSPNLVIEPSHLLRSLSKTRPSVTLADRTRLDMIYRSFLSDRDGQMGTGDLGRATGTRASLM